MTDDTNSLDRLRQEVDRIDRRIHELLIERSGVVARIGRAKGRSTVFIRPGRHANILRGLAERHTGPFPLMSLLRVWNEIIGPMTELQGPLSMAVFEGLEDSAREFYGSYIPRRVHADPAAVVEAVASGEATVGILPLPGRGPCWWPALLQVPEVRIVARLPFLGDARPALVVARMAPEASGQDHAVFAAAEGEAAPRLREAGLAPLGRIDPDEPAVTVAEGFLAADDPRVAALAGLGIALLGCYPVPLAANKPQQAHKQTTKD